MTIEIDSIPLRLKTDWLAMNHAKLPFPQGVPTQLRNGTPTVHLEVRNLRKSYGKHVAVNDVSFSIQGGEVLGLLGPNGAGKSTTMLMMAGLLDPTSGEVLLNGQKFNGRNLEQRRFFGIVPQEYAIYEELSAVDNLKFFGKLYGLRGAVLKIRCDDVLAEMGLTENAHRPAMTYSGGMKRRLNFGIALMHKPSILILDEPTLGVDPQSRTHLMDCIHRQTADGGCVVYASHYMEEAQAICQRVVILDQGKVLKNDSIHHLLEGLAADLYLFVDHTTGIANDLGGLARIGIGGDDEPAVIVTGNIRHAKADVDILPLQDYPSPKQIMGDDKNSDLGDRLQSTLDKLKILGIRVLSAETQQSNLEQLFLRLTGKRLRD
jgi:ABC-2 type transport system ATP-binding protein